MVLHIEYEQNTWRAGLSGLRLHMGKAVLALEMDLENVLDSGPHTQEPALSSAVRFPVPGSGTAHLPPLPFPPFSNGPP